MSAHLTGSLTTVRAAATYAANSTWYECTAATLKDAGAPSNRIAFFVTCATASAGTVDFYLEASPDGGTTDYDVCAPGDAPQVIASITFTGAATKCAVAEIGIVPGLIYKVWFRASAGAASATLLIKSLLFQSDAPIGAGDVEIAVEAMVALLTTIDADTGAIKTATELIDDAVVAHDAAASAKGLQTIGQANSSQQATVTATGYAVRASNNMYGERVIAGYVWANDAVRAEEIDPLSAQHGTSTLVNNTAVAADPGASYAPSSTGQALAGYRGATLQLYLLGGVGAAAADRTVTVTIEATTGLTVSAAVRWVDITESVKDLNTGLDSYASFAATGATAVDYMLDANNGNANWTHIRVKYDWDADPSVTAGAIVAVFRGRAL